MVTLRNGEFVFINNRKQLLLLERGTNQEAQIIYGGEVFAFACSEDETMMALALPSPSGGSSSLIRLYTFADNELGDAIFEVTTIKATQLLWSGMQYLVVCGPSGCTIYKWKNEKLNRVVPDSATSAFLQGDRVALFYPDSQTLKFWNLDSNRIMDSVKPSLRGRRLISTVGVGYFCFALYDDGSVQVYYVTKSNIKKLSLFERFFPVKQNEKVTHGTSSPLLACALSSRKVLVGLRGNNKVHKLEYKNEKHLVDSMQEELQEPFTLMAISRDGRRCLALNTVTGKYQTLVLSFSSVKTVLTETQHEKHSSNDSQETTRKGNTTCAPKGEENEGISVLSSATSNITSLGDKNKNIGKCPKVSNGTSPSPSEGSNRKYINGITITTFGVVVVMIGFLTRRILSSQRQ
ncbi:uncharacterized protein TM35_000051240 [Trypanosoma theileri]|uniref:Uncharacterized protein n=1 Tax=Trypanosoma theileri TaxID=67003 RepID=A0A1X0P3W4_9TRYP|nr:uncharacterized protein TM35_000051240 [Trypanosoma theileri]ORC91528.1 hypothetical protein TM35_000051240 [Trypanosoma theileri]